MATFNRPSGDITTLLDLTPRDLQDNNYFPLTSQTSWFTRDSTRRHQPFVPVLQDFQYRGPAAFGYRFSFDIASQTSGDLLLGAVLQIELGSWLDPTTVLLLQGELTRYSDPKKAWFYANAIGLILIQSVELEIDGVTIEKVDGDFSTVFTRLFPDLNTQFGLAADHLGFLSMDRLLQWNPQRVFPTENGYIHCLLPLFFQRTHLKEGLPLIACREGSVRIHVQLRPFSEVVRQARGFRDTCSDVPINRKILLEKDEGFYHNPYTITTSASEPQLNNVRLLTWGALLDGSLRNSMLRQPFEVMHRDVQTFYFAEPLKYAASTTNPESVVRVQLPLEANHPLEEIIWFVRRTDVSLNNEWTNYSSVLEKEYDPIFNPRGPLLVSAKIQANGIDLVEGEESYFRNLISKHHKGGIVAYNSFIYGYPFARHPGQHQPSGSINASRLQSLRLVLDVVSTGTWEVKVFCIGLNWLRFENGMANHIFTD
jgi:hypothetical protein